MRCPSCGAISESSECCAVDNAGAVDQGHENGAVSSKQVEMSQSSQGSNAKRTARSTLIEFPGVSRNSIPEWRKELSERVREVQERRAREATREAAEAERQEDPESTSPPQLELLPPAEMPPINPLVVAALKRIERAHQPAPNETRQLRSNLATAVAYAPDLEVNDCAVNVESEIQELAPPAPLEIHDEAQVEVVTVEKTHNLVVVAAEVEAVKTEPPPAPKRLIVDDDPALNYLDSISRDVCVEDESPDRASAFRRFVGALMDLLICALLSSPIAFAMRFAGFNLRDNRTIAILAGCVVVMIFIYLTLTTALTGRTWAMRLLSLRVIDKKTGLIPTGSQSLGRSFLYLLSLATAGIGILFALVSREGYTVHDRLTRTAVIIT